jgi:uncharacterized membrane protein
MSRMGVGVCVNVGVISRIGVGVGVISRMGVGLGQMVGKLVGEGTIVLSATGDIVGCAWLSDAVAMTEGRVKASKRAAMKAKMGQANRKILDGVRLCIFFSFEGFSLFSLDTKDQDNLPTLSLGQQYL